MINHRGLVGVGGIDGSGRPDINDNVVALFSVKEIGTGCYQVASQADFRVESEIVEGPLPPSCKHAWIAGKLFIRTAGTAIGYDWIF